MAPAPATPLLSIVVPCFDEADRLDVDAFAELARHVDQVLFVDLGPTEGRGERVITALGQAYSPIDAPCYVV